MMKLFLLFYVFFKIGLFSFGGGYVMLPMIYQEIQTFNLIPVKEFADIVALSQMTPGPIAVNAATYVGFKYAGLWGATFATIGVSLPSFIIILIISAFFYRFKNNPVIDSVLSGIRPATVGMIATAVLFFAETSIFNGKLLEGEILRSPLTFINLPALAIFIGTLILSVKFRIGPITLTLLAGVVGALVL